jgi:lipopolysaccharide biosynthesis glycosyltransferase
MKLAVVIGCNDNYVKYAIGALRKFLSTNPSYDAFILGTKFSSTSKDEMLSYSIRGIEINLCDSFPYLDKRPYGLNYPIECFYHLYAYKVLPEYDYILSIEPDIITQLAFDLDFSKIRYVAGVIDDNHIRHFTPIMNDLSRILTKFPTVNIDQYRIRGGFKVYNVKGCGNIGFFERIINLYKQSFEIGAPRCGDDSLFVLYQILYPGDISTLDRRYMIIDDYKDLTQIYCYHDGSSAKWWNDQSSPSSIARFFKRQMRTFLGLPE